MGTLLMGHRNNPRRDAPVHGLKVRLDEGELVREHEQGVRADIEKLRLTPDRVRIRRWRWAVADWDCDTCGLARKHDHVHEANVKTMEAALVLAYGRAAGHDVKARAVLAKILPILVIARTAVRGKG